jgi:PAS domain S-box-containing protein
MPTPLRALLIDDSDADVQLALRELRHGGFAPQAQRVDNATALRAALAETWDVVLCDWHLPGFSGEEALEILRAAQVDAPIIVVSSDRDDSGPVSALRGGAHEFVSKLALPRLVPAVERALREVEFRRERNRSEAELRASEERFAKAFEYAPIGMAMVTIEGTIIKVNAAMCEMFGYSEEEMSNLPVWRITHPDDMAEPISQLQRLIEGEIDTWLLEKRYFHRNGDLLWGRSTTWLVRDPSGAARYVVSQVQDSTEWKRLQGQTGGNRPSFAHVPRVATMGGGGADRARDQSAAGVDRQLRQRPDCTLRPRPHQHCGDARGIGPDRRRGAARQRGDPPPARFSAQGRSQAGALRCQRRRARRNPPARARRPPSAIRLNSRWRPTRCRSRSTACRSQVVLNLLRNAVDALIPRSTGARDLAIATERGEHRSRRARATAASACRAAGDAFRAFFTTKETGLARPRSAARSSKPTAALLGAAQQAAAPPSALRCRSRRKKTLHGFHGIVDEFHGIRVRFFSRQRRRARHERDQNRHWLWWRAAGSAQS